MNRPLPFALLVVALSGLSTLAACAADTSDTSGVDQGGTDTTPPNGDDGERDGGPTGDDGADADGDPNEGRDGSVVEDGGGLGPFGVTSCQPAFEHACKPPVTFVDDEPDGRGKIFTDVIADVEKTEQEIACTACSILYRDPSEIPEDRHPSKIEIVLDKGSSGNAAAVALVGEGKIRFFLSHIGNYEGQSPDVVKQEMLGVLQHETVHLYQNYGNAGTGEGLADLVRARTGYYPKSRWQAGEGTWKDPYTASGNFYSWLTGPCSFHDTFYSGHDLDFPYKLNQVLAGKSGNAAYTATSKLIQTTFGKSVDDLWSEYQATAF